MSKLSIAALCLLLGAAGMFFALSNVDHQARLGANGTSIIGAVALAAAAFGIAGFVLLLSWRDGRRKTLTSQANPGSSPETWALGLQAGVYGLIPGATYRVIQPIRDHYGNNFTAGEELDFVVRHYLPYHGGHTVIFKTRPMYLQDQADASVLDSLSSYLEVVALPAIYPPQPNNSPQPNNQPPGEPQMKPSRKIQLVAALLLAGGVIGIAAQNLKGDPPSIRLADADYFHRWAQDDQHEYTPRGQENLEHWADMITINYYRDARDGEGLSAKANAVIDNYKGHRAIILKTSSVPRTPAKPAEYFVSAVFGRPEFIEVVFNRFKIVDGVGLSLAYSHREYGKEIGNQMKAWLDKNGPPKEKALLELDKIPVPAEVKK